MPISRRFFLKSGTLTAISAGLLSGASPLALGQKRSRLEPGFPGQVRKDLVYYSSPETFKPYIGSIFRARGARGEVLDLTLISVNEYKPSPSTRISTLKSPDTDCFSLHFTGLGQLPPFSRIPALYHAAFGKLELFLTPHGQEDGVFLYEAVINHVR